MESCLASKWGITWDRFLSFSCGFVSTVCSLVVEFRDELGILIRFSRLTAELPLYIIRVLLLGYGV